MKRVMTERSKAIDIRLLRMDRELTADEWIRLSRFVSAEKRERLSRFHNSKDANRSLLAELLVKATVSGRTGCPVDSINFKTNDFGKPLLSNPLHLHFNISHSGKWIAAIIAAAEVGIDVEEIRPIDLLIAQRFFTAEEYSQLTAVPEPDRTAFFFTLWTLKESYVKAVGEGLRIPLNSFGFHVDEGSSIRFEAKPGGRSSSADGSSYRFGLSRIADDAVLAYCCSSDGYLQEHACLGVDELLAEIGSLEGRST